MNHLKTLFLMLLLTAILLVAGELIIGGSAGLTIAFVIALLMNFFAYWYSAGPLQVNEAASHMFIMNPLSVKGMSALFSTHPPIPDRVRRLQQMR